MRRFTLSALFLALFAVAVNAQDEEESKFNSIWLTDIEATETVSDLQRGAPMTIDAKNSPIVTGCYNKTIQIGTLAELDNVATSAFIAKYSNAAAEEDPTALWQVALKGAATIKAITTDEDCNVYVAGVFADAVSVVDATGEAVATINGIAEATSQSTAFIISFTADGKYIASKTIIPQTDATVTSDADMMYFSEPNFVPSKLIASNGKLYMSASYKGNATIDNVELKGKYTLAWGFMYDDLASMAVLALDTKNLDGAELVSSLGSADQIVYDGTDAATDVNFAIKDGKVYIAYVGTGSKLKLAAGSTSNDVELQTTTDGENTSYEHPFILACVDGKNATNKVYHSVVNSNSADWNTIDEMQFNDGKLYLAGTFNEANPFDNTVSYVSACDTYLACINPETLDKNWLATSNYDEADANHKAEIVSFLVFIDNEATVAGGIQNTTDRSIESTKLLTVSLDAPTSCEYDGDEDDDYCTAAVFNGDYILIQTDNANDTDTTDGGEYEFLFAKKNNSSTGIHMIKTGNGLSISRQGDVINVSETADLSLYSAAGTLVKSAKAATSISLAGLGKGVYMLKAGQKTVKVNK